MLRNWPYRDVAIIEAFVPGMDVSVFVVEGKTLQIHAPHKREISAADPASPPMMDVVEEALLERGVARERLVFERFELA